MLNMQLTRCLRALALYFCLSFLLLASGAQAKKARFVDGQNIALEVGNEAAFDSKIRLIQNARQSLDLAYYIYTDDFTSSYLTQQLIQKARQGVKVRLIVDWAMVRPYINVLKAVIKAAEQPNGVQNLSVAYFRPLPASVKEDLRSWGFTRDEDIEKVLRAITSFDAETIKKAILEARTGGTPSPLNLLSPFAADDTDLLPILESYQRGLAPTSFTGLLKEMLAPLKQRLPGATVHPSAWLAATKRLHHKLLVADRRWVQGGGRNIEDSYHWEIDHPLRDPQRSKYVFMDVDFRIDSPALAADALETIDDYWACADGLPCKSGVEMERESPATDAQSAEIIADMERKAKEYLAKRGYTRRQKPIHEGRFDVPLGRAAYLENRMFVDPSSSATFLEEERSQYHKAWVSLIRRVPAGGHVVIQSAYLWFPPGLQMAVAKAIRRGVHVTILSNSPESSDLGFIAQLARLQYVELLKLGQLQDNLHIYEYVTAESLHAKISVLGDYVLVGSTNADPRCEFLDSNNGIAVKPSTTRFNGKWYFSLAGAYREWLENLRSELLTTKRPLKSGEQAYPLREVTEQSIAAEREELLAKLDPKDRALKEKLLKLLSMVMEESFNLNQTGAKARGFLNSLFLQL